MSGQREIRVHHGGSQRTAGYLVDEWYRSPRSSQVERDKQGRRVPPEVIAHLCPVGCPKHPISTGAFHATEVAGEMKPPEVPKEPIQAEGPLISKEDVKTGSRSFQGTPLDPTRTVKWFLKKRVSKKKRHSQSHPSKGLRKEAVSVSSASHSSRSSTSGSTLDSQDSGHPFKEGHRVKRLSRKIPHLY